VSERWDAIVVGLGGVGSAALWRLALRGVRVLGLDRFPPGHDRGSSHGATRIIRLAYMEAPDYVPLLRRSFELWSELEVACGQELYRQTGLLQVGPRDGPVVQGIERTAREHQLSVEVLEATEVRARFAGFDLPETSAGVFDPRAGYLHVERCVVAATQQAARLGAEVRTGVEVHGWSADGGDVVVETDQGPLRAGRLVVTPGAWAGDLLAELGVPFVIRRKSLFWYEAPAEPYAPDAGCPCFLYETPAGVFYGFPRLDEGGLKLAEHSGGRTVNDPLRLDREVDAGEQSAIEGFLRQHLPDVSATRRRHGACMYTVTPDEHFVVDRHPTHPQVCFAAGLSGHGFKMAPVLGQALAELALDGQSQLPIGFLGLGRPALSG